MDLFILNVDQGHLEQIHKPDFAAEKRVVYLEKQVNEAIFRSNEVETMASESQDVSTFITGGAGTGKTLLMIRKVAGEDTTRRTLVISRLPRLVTMIKSAVEEKRSSECTSFMVYDDLMKLLARRVIPKNGFECKFVISSRIRFDCDESNISFSRQFIDTYLNAKERRQMKSLMVEPLTLWNAIITIKSNSNCATTKQPLSQEVYINLPASFGLKKDQRLLCYELFTKYEQWRLEEHGWDDSDRVLYILRYGPSVFQDERFIPWAQRVNSYGETDGLLNEEGNPLYPFFWELVTADEAQDFTEVELVLFSKMSASIRSLFLCADSAQSVEVGVKMRGGTVNDVFHSLMKDGKQQVKDVLQYITLQTNHRTHAQNLAIGQAVRRILARSFKVPYANEIALINGKIPKTMMIKELNDITSCFRGGNCIFLAPDEKVHELRLQFNKLGLMNDVFGVREAKGLEFDSVALIGFFSYIDECGSSEQWTNVLRWLSSSSTLSKTSSTGEKVSGVVLADCDYTLSAPNVSDEAMMVYTALTRARNHLYLIEVDSIQTGKKQKRGLAGFAFRRFGELGLAKSVLSIDEGQVEMTAAQHKARGVLYVTQVSPSSYFV